MKALRKEITRLKQDFIQRMTQDTKGHEAKVENLSQQLKDKDGRLEQLQTLLREVKEAANTRQIELNEREKKINEFTEQLKNQPPITHIDDGIKRSRDLGLIQIRKQRADIDRLEKENAKFLNGIQQAEKLINVKNSELATMTTAHGEIKESFVNNLNEQARLHQSELDKKEQRISQLEHLMMNKIRLADSTRE